jgi:hypothetical protein
MIVAPVLERYNDLIERRTLSPTSQRMTVSFKDGRLVPGGEGAEQRANILCPALKCLEWGQ